jgi:AcrR family transcriptional regulator
MKETKPVADRRIQKTLRLLHDALFSLIREKSYESIVVKEILDRANVGRSTFYTHFQSKDELLVSGIRDTLHGALAARPVTATTRHDAILSFSLPVFEQIYQHRGKGDAKMDVKARAVAHEHLQSGLAEVLATNLAKGLRRSEENSANIPADLLVQYLASTFILVLNWWMEATSPMPPSEINAIFCALVQPTLLGTKGGAPVV